MAQRSKKMVPAQEPRPCGQSILEGGRGNQLKLKREHRASTTQEDFLEGGGLSTGEWEGSLGRSKRIKTINPCICLIPDPQERRKAKLGSVVVNARKNKADYERFTIPATCAQPWRSIFVEIRCQKQPLDYTRPWGGRLFSRLLHTTRSAEARTSQGRGVKGTHGTG